MDVKTCVSDDLAQILPNVRRVQLPNAATKTKKTVPPILELSFHLQPIRDDSFNTMVDSPHQQRLLVPFVRVMFPGPSEARA